jgi:hypothetical protein
MGGLKVSMIKTSTPVTAPSPPVNWLGLLLMPFTTVLATAKLGFKTVALELKREDEKICSRCKTPRERRYCEVCSQRGCGTKNLVGPPSNPTIPCQPLCREYDACGRAALDPKTEIYPYAMRNA